MRRSLTNSLAAGPLVAATLINPSACTINTTSTVVAGSGTSSPTFASPAKSKPYRDLSPSCAEEMPDEVCLDNHNSALAHTPQTNPIAAFPNNGQPVSDTKPKEKPLRASLQSDLLTCLNQQRAEIQDLGDWVDHIETALSDFTENYNTLVDAHSAQGEYIGSKQNSWTSRIDPAGTT